jgi:hypothetical protein
MILCLSPPSSLPLLPSYILFMSSDWIRRHFGFGSHGAFRASGDEVARAATSHHVSPFRVGFHLISPRWQDSGILFSVERVIFVLFWIAA